MDSFPTNQSQPSTEDRTGSEVFGTEDSLPPIYKHKGKKGVTSAPGDNYTVPTNSPNKDPVSKDSAAGDRPLSRDQATELFTGSTVPQRSQAKESGTRKSRSKTNKAEHSIETQRKEADAKWEDEVSGNPPSLVEPSNGTSAVPEEAEEVLPTEPSDQVYPPVKLTTDGGRSEQPKAELTDVAHHMAGLSLDGDGSARPFPTNTNGKRSKRRVRDHTQFSEALPSATPPAAPEVPETGTSEPAEGT